MLVVQGAQQFVVVGAHVTSAAGRAGGQEGRVHVLHYGGRPAPVHPPETITGKSLSAEP
jgi:hypothetical protein